MWLLVLGFRLFAVKQALSSNAHLRCCKVGPCIVKWLQCYGKYGLNSGQSSNFEHGFPTFPPSSSTSSEETCSRSMDLQSESKFKAFEMAKRKEQNQGLLLLWFCSVG